MGWPEEFVWGTAASSSQAEGAAPASDWAYLAQRGLVPPMTGNGFDTRYAEDFRLLADHGLTHHRLSIEWARIEPAAGRRDPHAIEHYEAVLEAARAAGVVPWVCLHHFTLPGWFAVDEGGFRRDRDRARYLWSAHVDFVAERLGDLVGGWQPVNEPVAYVLDYLAPGLPADERTPGKLATLVETMHLVAGDAARLVRGGGPVATILDLHPVEPADDSPEARQAARHLDDLWWASWNRPELLAPFDLLGFSYYHAVQVDGSGARLPYPPGVALGPLGYAPWPSGLGLVLERLADAQPLPILVAELGLGTTDDEARAGYLTDALGVLRDALEGGIDVRGCFFWTGIDNDEWQHGRSVPFGLVDRDRNPRPSLGTVQALIADR